MVIFTFTTHNHQPLGNFDHVIEEAYEKSYRPFFELAQKYPIRFATHFTGILLDWLAAKHPEQIALLRSMVGSGQLEIVSGGFFEPILSVTPPQDQQAQIRMLSERIEQLFGPYPTGMWLAERVWEQPLAATLHDAGMRYVLLDDTHFLHAGLRSEDLNGYYLTEDRGKTLAVFPISKELRYTIPFQPVDETIRVLRDASTTNSTTVVSFADDGEKFGVWPRTYDYVYGEGWLEEFFRKLAENQSWIRMMHPREVLHATPPRGRIYLPNASYAEMNEWALPSAAMTQQHEDFVHALEKEDGWKNDLAFVRGGYWRNFLTKYPEINQLHKHMLATSERLSALAAIGLDVREARRELLAAQCNDPYWHGVFGGAYLPNLRHANFSALVRADRLLDGAEGLHALRTHVFDLDSDGTDEIVLESPQLAVHLKPSLGGAIAELDFKGTTEQPRNFNAMNVITRREEAYHRKLTRAARPSEETETKSIHDIVETKEPGLEKLLIFDWYRRMSMIEHFLDATISADALRTNAYHEHGDFVQAPFDWQFSSGDSVIELYRSGQVDGRPIGLTKRIELHEGQLKVTYALSNDSNEALRLQFASEWALNLLAPDAADRYFESNGERLAEPQLRSQGSIPGGNIRIVDAYLRLAISIDAADAAEIIRYPLETVSTSEAGFERIYQGSILLAVWPLDLAAGSVWTRELTLSFEAI